MSCHNCCSEFGLFKKEYGCESCGFAFCGRCCNKKTVNDVEGKSKKLLCSSCFTKLSGGKVLEVDHSSLPPSALEKRLAFGKHSFSLDTRPGVISTDNMNEKDKQIAERLQKLKRERTKELLPSQSEIEERFAKLKGMDPAKYTAPPIMVYRPTDKRPLSQQADDLIKEVQEEVQIDASIVKPEEEIAERLSRLQVVSPRPQKCSEGAEVDIDEASASFQADSERLTKTAEQQIKDLNQNEDYRAFMKSMKNRKGEKANDVSDEDTDEEEASKIINQLLVPGFEGELDEPESLDAAQTLQGMDVDGKGERNETDPEEFPWCVICTEDARLRCFNCDGDLYCMRCFRDCHDNLDIKDHKTCPFLSPKV